jgi:Putative zinc-finger
VNGMHDPGELSAHALGLLSGAQARAVEQHLASCAACRLEWSELRETATMLDGVPPEMFLDGPPDDDLLLQRTMRRIRAETGSRRRRRRLGQAVAAAAVAVALLGAGVFAGQQLAPEPTVVAAPAPAPAPPVPAGTRTAEGSQGPVTMSATITPANGWVRLAATVRGIPPGERCSLIVLAKDGSEHLAGSWLVGQPSPVPGAPLQGSTIIDPADVAGVTIRNEAGREFITVRV